MSKETSVQRKGSSPCKKEKGGGGRGSGGEELGGGRRGRGGGQGRECVLLSFSVAQI